MRVRRRHAKTVVLVVAGALVALISYVFWPRPPHLVLLCGSIGRTTDVGKTPCPFGTTVKRTLLIPASLGANLADVQMGGITFPITLIADGIAGTFRAIWLHHPYVQSQSVFLSPGRVGLFDYELNRIIDAYFLPSRDPKREASPEWSEEADPDFSVLDGKFSRTVRTTGMRPLLLVPKSGEHIIFLCWDKADRPADVAIDPLCDVHDMVGGPEQDELRYQLYSSHLKDWRQYSKWSWSFIDAMSVMNHGQ